MLGRRLREESGLRLTEYDVLVPPAGEPGGLLRARRLADRLGREQRSRLSHQVGRMARRGLVTKEDCDVDARGAMIRITEAGSAAFAAAEPGHAAAVRRYFIDVVAPEEVGALGKLMDRVAAVLARGGLRPRRADRPDPRSSPRTTDRRVPPGSGSAPPARSGVA